MNYTDIIIDALENRVGALDRQIAFETGRMQDCGVMVRTPKQYNALTDNRQLILDALTFIKESRDDELH
jgi:hypothetical protein